MNEKKLWRQAFPMGKKGSIVVGVIAFALVVFLAWKAFRTPNDRDSLAPAGRKDQGHGRSSS
jgi:hypothetical protein